MRSLALLALVVVAAVGCAGSDEPALEVTGTIAFWRGDHVWLMNADGSAQRRLARGSGPSWSPDGRRIRGSGPSWSPDGRRIAFSVDTRPGSEIFVIGADGGGRLKLTRRQFEYDRHFSPVWSPDGRTIAFQGYDDGNWWISVVGADGTGQRALETGGRVADVGAVWSRDGRTIVFTSNGVFYAMKPDGSGRRPLARIKGAWCCVVWSPDRRHFTDLSGSDLWVMSSDGTPLGMLYDVPVDKDWVGGVSWSPDGTSIAFSVQEGKAPEGTDRDTEIFVVGSDGSGLRQLTDNEGVLDDAPAWSPEGTAIAFTTDRDGNSEIYVMDADGSDERNVSNHPGVDLEPAWSPTP